MYEILMDRHDFFSDNRPSTGADFKVLDSLTADVQDDVPKFENQALCVKVGRRELNERFKGIVCYKFR